MSERRESLFPNGCTCFSYGRGLAMTRVNSRSCPVHGDDFLLDLHAALDAVSAPKMEDYPEPQRAIHRVTQLSFDLNQEVQRLERECEAWELHGQKETFARERAELGVTAPGLDVLREVAVDVVLADDLTQTEQIAALWQVVRRHTAIAKKALGDAR